GPRARTRARIRRRLGVDLRLQSADGVQPVAGRIQRQPVLWGWVPRQRCPGLCRFPSLLVPQQPESELHAQEPRVPLREGPAGGRAMRSGPCCWGMFVTLSVLAVGASNLDRSMTVRQSAGTDRGARV